MSNRYSLRRTAVMVLLGLMALSAAAIPAKPGLWRKITLKSGQQIFVQLRGDEHASFLADKEGNAYTPNGDGTYSQVSVDEAVNGAPGSEKAKAKQAFAAWMKQQEAKKAPTKRRISGGIPSDKSKFRGQKRGLVILVNFKDEQFGDTYKTFNGGYSSVSAMYKDIINNPDFNAAPFQGSVRRFFRDQSHGKFDLDFDVVGPVTLSQNKAYYGSPLYSRSGRRNNYTYTAQSNDAHAGYMVYEAIQSAFSGNYTDEGGNRLDASNYDWDGDGEMEFVFVLYAGQGQADGGADDCIWPHQFTLSSSYQTENYYGRYSYYIKNGNSYTRFTANRFGAITANNTKIDTYACSNELATNQGYDSNNNLVTNGTQLDGIGAFCHEFSHCMGYPDLYDTNYGGNYGMGYWDIMDRGNYNGSWNGGHDDWPAIQGGYCPAGYSAFERWCAGWDEPIELTDPQKITNMKPLGGTINGVDDYGPAYVVYMPGSQKNIEGEYYLLENRQELNWDSYVPWNGLLVNYVQYNETLWSNNGLNTTGDGSNNSHQRMTVFQAAGPDPGYFQFDTYPWKTSFIWDYYRWNSSAGSNADEVIDYINKNYGDYGVTLNTTDMDHLDDTSTPQAYYWGSGSSSRTLTGHEIWNIESNGWVATNSDKSSYWRTGDPNRTVNFIYRKATADKPLQLDENAATPQAITAGLYTSVTTNKTVRAGRYNTLWLPYAMNMREVQQTFGSGAKVYYFTGVSTTDGVTQLNFDDSTRRGIPAYKPVLIRLADGDNEVNVSTAALATQYMQVTTDLAKAGDISETHDGWTFRGTTQAGIVPEGDVFISDNLYYYSRGATTLKAYRAYFVPPTTSSAKAAGFATALRPDTGDATTLTDSDLPGAFSRSEMSLLNAPSDATLVTAINGTPTLLTTPTADNNVYNLSGQRVGTLQQLNSLPKGVYIVHGRKVIRK